MQIHRTPWALDSHLHEFARDKVDTLQKCSELGTEQTKRNSSKGGEVWFQPQIRVLIRKAHKSTQFKQSVSSIPCCFVCPLKGSPASCSDQQFPFYPSASQEPPLPGKLCGTANSEYLCALRRSRTWCCSNEQPKLLFGCCLWLKQQILAKITCQK